MSDKSDFLVPGGALSGRVLMRVVKELGGEAPVDPPSLHDHEDLARLGESIGPYTLIRELGSGGMGAVYLAEHNDESVTRHVALKALRVSATAPGIRERFWRERQVLAGLSHPNIAQLHDAGATESGILYYTMEYVDGLSITRYCRENLPSISARVRLIRQIAVALARAHRNLIIHRDIKPSNVMVTVDGHVKLLDFGIAKSLAESPDSGLTQSRIGPMTPKYAAPEQFHGARLTVATDIYQLGVLSYRVLTGRLPYRADPNDPLAWGRAVTEEEPLAMSRAIDSAPLPSAPEASSPARPNAVGLARVRRALRGDLDAIVRKMLAKNPDHRYVSMDGLIADLDAFVAGRPVTARRGSGTYRLRRFIVRNAAACITGLAGMVAVGIVVGQLRVERDRAQVAAAVAQAQADRATRAKDLVVDIIRETDSSVVPYGTEFSAAQFLEAAAQRVDADMTNLPDVQAEIRAAIASSLERSVGSSRALPMIDRSIADTRLLDEASRQRLLPEMLATQARARNESGDPRGAERAANEALAITATEQAANWRTRIRAKAALMRSENLLGRDAEAYRLTREILADRIAALGPEHPDVAMDYQNLAYAELYLDRFAAAEADYRHAERMLTRLVPGDNNPRLAWILNGLGMTLTKRGQFDEAEKVLQHSRDIYAAMSRGSDTSTYVADVALHQAILELARKRFDRAAQRLKEAENFNGDTDIDKRMPTLRAVQAQLMLETNHFTEAATLAASAAKAISAQRGADHPTALRMPALAAFARFLANPKSGHDHARTELQRVYKSLSNASAPAAEERIAVGEWLAEVLQSGGETDRATALRNDIHQLRLQILGDDFPAKAP